MFWKRRASMRKNWFACGSCSKGASETEMTFEWNAVAEISALRIVECLVEGTLVTIFAGLVMRVAGGQTSSAKFAVWFSALMAIAALPLLGGSSWSHANAPSGSLSPAITVPASWALYLFSAWAVVAAWFLMRVGRGLWHLHILRKSCVPVDRELLDVRLKETLERNRGTRQIELCTSERVQVDRELLDVRLKETLERNRGTRQIELCTSERVQVDRELLDVRLKETLERNRGTRQIE